MTCLIVIRADQVDASGAAVALWRLRGQTLLERAILAARAADPNVRVMIAASMPEVTAAASREQIETVPSPATPTGDDAAAALAIVRSLGGRLAAVDVVACADCVHPVVTGADIAGTVAALLSSTAAAAAAVAPVRRFLWRRAAGGAVPVGHDGPAAARPAPDIHLLETGAVYAFRAPPAEQPFSGTLAINEVPVDRGFRISEPSDLARAEALLEPMAARQVLDHLPAVPAALIMDFDGVFTDNRVLVDQDGREAVLCNRGDGMGLEHLRHLGLPMLVLSKERNPVVAARCAKLRLDCLQGIEDKRPALEAWCRDRGVATADVVYVGNDVNDIACFQAVGCAIAVADSHAEVLRHAHVVLSRDGGQGALRELADLLASRLKPS
jgi:N-acylneuraminate cytidylyltransferase